MLKKTFSDFTKSKGVSGAAASAFYAYLAEKYPNGIPQDVDLNAEWAEFYRESTSRC